METFEIVNGYDRTKNPAKLRVRRATSADILQAPRNAFGNIVMPSTWYECTDGKARNIRVSGKLQLWKRDPERFRLPIKFGLYENGELTPSNISRLLIVVEG